MDRVSALARLDSISNGSYRAILPITVVIWLANLGILVTRSYAIGASTGWTAFLIRLVVSIAGAAVCLLTYKFVAQRCVRIDGVSENEAKFRSGEQYVVEVEGAGPNT